MLQTEHHKNVSECPSLYSIVQKDKLIHCAKVLCRIQYKIGHVGVVLPSQSLGLIIQTKPN